MPHSRIPSACSRKQTAGLCASAIICVYGKPCTQSPKAGYLGTASFDRGLKWGGFRLGITHRIDPDLDTERTYISSNLSNAGVISSYTKPILFPPWSAETLPATRS